MTDKRKKLARALSEKTGMSHQGAINALTTKRNRGQSPPTPNLVSATRPIDQLLAGLGAQSAFRVSVGQAHAVSRSATLEVAQQNAAYLAANPSFVAKSGSGEMTVSQSEMNALLAQGAAAHGIQMIRSFHNEHGVSFSVKCASCGGWIWCGREEHSSRCACGRAYRVAFDLTPEDWSLAQNTRCIDCGTEQRLTVPSEGRNPSRPINEWQVRCNLCDSARPSTGLDESMEAPYSEQR